MKKFQTTDKVAEEVSDHTNDQPTKKSKKGCAIAAGIIGGVLVAFVVLIIVLSSTLGKNRPASNTRSDTVQASQLAEVMKLDAEQEKAMLEVFAKCGIGEVQSVERFQEGEQRTSYYVEDEETIHYSGADNAIVVWIGNSSRSVKAIYFHDETIYEKGEVKAQLSDFYVPYEMIEDYRVAAQMLINECLQYPKTAKYGAKSKWSVGVRDGLDVLQSTVTAKNAFGMESEMKFTVKFDRKTQAPVSVILDGEEMMKKN